MKDRGLRVSQFDDWGTGAEDSGSARLLYREDDGNFKRRLNSAIQMSWVFNTALTILVCAVLFYILDYNLVMGIIFGVLIAMISNLHLTLSRVTRASRWEIYNNRVVMPRGFRGGNLTIHFDDIDSIQRQKGVAGDTMTITMMGGESLTLDVEEQRKPLEALDLAYRQYAKGPGVPQDRITIPVNDAGAL
jgi:hypothetical protein